tara:strand:- start:72 stop:1250 length:1179 start_codon:yes stop_codon:yes gene_type:complete
MSFIKYCLFILGPCAMLQPLGMDIFISELPRMMSQLNITEHEVQYILATFVFASGFPQLFIGYLSDKYGRRVVMLAATASFAITSCLCALSTDLFLLSTMRFFQGVSAAASLVVSYSVVRDLFDGVEASKKYSQLSCILAITPMVAPLLGAFLIDSFGYWQATFYFLVMFASTVFLLAQRFMPNTLSSCKLNSPHLDYKESIKIIILNRQFWTFCLCATTTMAGLFLYFSIGSILLMDKLHLSSYQYSGLFAINAISYLTSNFSSSILVKRVDMKTLVLAGNVLVIIGASLMMALNITFGLNAVAIVATNLLITIGGGLITGPSTSKALAPFPDNTGMASGLFGTIQYGLPAFLGVIVTRFDIVSTANLAIPMLILAAINMSLLLTNKTVVA